MGLPKTSESCYACGKDGNYSVMLARTNGRIYLPNQRVREHGALHSDYGEVAFCASCMSAIEDSLRKAISSLQSEHGIVPLAQP